MPTEKDLEDVKQALEQGKIPLDATKMGELLDSVRTVLDATDQFLDVAMSHELEEFPEDVRTPMALMAAYQMIYYEKAREVAKDLVLLKEAAEANPTTKTETKTETTTE